MISFRFSNGTLHPIVDKIPESILSEEEVLDGKKYVGEATYMDLT